MPPLKSKVSLRDIAEEAEVSVSLVSKVLNDRMGTTGVSPELAEKIRKTAERLRYQQNASALALRQGRHDVIGVVIHRHGEPGSALIENMVLGIAGAAQDLQQKLMLGFIDTDEEFLTWSRSAHRGLMDGLILGGLPHERLQKRVVEIMDDGLPVVSIHNEPLHDDIPNVGIDQSETAYLATHHLVERGCTHIAQLRHNEDRHQGFVRAMEEAGFSVDQDLLFSVGSLRYTYQAGVKAAKYYLQKELTFDGVVCDSDQQAAGFCNTLRQVGVEVPGQVKVVGVDNSPFCDYLFPSLTSVSQKSKQAGIMAVQLMHELQQGHDVDSVRVAPELMVRESTAA